MKDTAKIVDKIKEQQKIIDNANLEIAKLTKELLDTNEDDWDFVSVKRGADAIGVSVWSVYRKIETGAIKAHKFGGKTLVSLSELKGVAI